MKGMPTCGRGCVVATGNTITRRMRSSTRRGTEELHPGEWPEQSGRPRVLIENPDGAELSAHADVLRDVTGDALELTLPVLPRQLVEAVDGVRSFISASAD
jgi:hypothetical protein